ncbi:OPT family oligopeptide transporter [Anaeromusa acidaminophila]|uniref:OPT family oligopeptide transporter n=1 Tax=Anaeromusa acidaminophila TaxID=81464 RepID=UPI00035CE2C0|nr:oligopeptide transporter, OPT family [Anaeromusa acidaminophila]
MDKNKATSGAAGSCFLSEAAFLPLREGETYEPILKAQQKPKEATLYAVLLGLLFGAVFTVACTYMPLKVGQGVSADTPIAAMAIALAAVLKRNDALGENTLMECIGSTGSMDNSGLVFVLPALFILQLQATFAEMVWTTLLGGLLGIAYAIILRNYFVVHMHGHYPFPGSLATTEVLLSGAQGGGSLRVLLFSSLVGGAADFATNSFGWWNAAFTSRFCTFGSYLAEKYKLLFAINVEAAVLAIGYMTGWRYAVIIAGGSLFGWWVLLPFMASLSADNQAWLLGTGAEKVFQDMTPEAIFRQSVRFIGIGTLAMAGILGVLKMAPFIGLAFKEAIVGIWEDKKNTSSYVRTQQDVPIAWVVGLIALIALVFALLIHLNYGASWLQALLLTVVLLAGSFLFSVVGTTSIAFTSSEPVSGLTLLTLIIGAQAMLSTGLVGEVGILAVLLMATVVCGCLWMTGCFVGDLKVAFWLGITPKTLQIWKVISTLVSAFIAAGVMLLLAKSMGFSGPGALAAPQANAVAAVIGPLMSGQEAPWTLYLAGAVLAVLLDRLKVPALAFGLGLYIPLELNMPLLAGGGIAYLMAHSSRDAILNQWRQRRGILISSGFIAGGSIMGVCSAGLRVMGYDFSQLSWGSTETPELYSLVMYVCLCGFFIWYSRRGKPTV